ncbi:hypothetical protein, partial [Pseudomonas syringae]|uniref:hypothetical protein n=1 Tax=Pseudomonas syringae TaxID=317 RepID=UPI001E545D54
MSRVPGRANVPFFGATVPRFVAFLLTGRKVLCRAWFFPVSDYRADAPRSALHTHLFLILAEGRGSELVRESAG